MAGGNDTSDNHGDIGFANLSTPFAVVVIGAIVSATIDSAILARKDDATSAPRMISFGGHF